MNTIRKSLYTLIGHFLIYAQGLFLTPLVIKISGPEVYGKYILLTSYLGIVFGISSLGVGISARRSLPSLDTQNERGNLFYPQFLFQLIMVTSLALVSMILFKVTNIYNKLPHFSLWLIPFYLLSYTFHSQGTDYFRYTHRIGVFNFSTISQPYLFVGITLMIYFTMHRLDVTTLLFSLSISCIIISLLLMIFVWREIGLPKRFYKVKELIAEIRLGFPVVLSFIVDTILSVGDRYIISIFLSDRDVGMYAPAYTLGSLLIFIPKVFGVVLPPILCRYMDANDIHAAKDLNLKAIRFYLLLIIPYIAGSWVLGKEVLTIYTNHEIAAKAWMVTPFVATGMLFYGLILIYSNILFIRLRTMLLFRINAMASFLNVILNILFLWIIPDIIVSAIVTLLSYMISYFLLVSKIKKDYIFVSIAPKWLFSIIVLSILIGAVSYIVSKSFGSNHYLGAGYGIIAGGTIYLVMLYILRLANVEFGYIQRLFNWRAV